MSVSRDSCDDMIDVDTKMLFRLSEEEMKNTTLYVSLLCEDIFFQEYLLGAVSLDLGIADYRAKQDICEEIIPVKKVGQQFHVSDSLS